MNKQIEEMGSVIFEVSPIANLWKSDAIKIAESLYKDGYRKASQEGAECPTCHGTGCIGTTDWLTRGIDKEKLAKEREETLAEYEAQKKRDMAREIFEEIEEALFNNHCLDDGTDYPIPHYYEELKDDIADLKKKYESE